MVWNQDQRSRDYGEIATCYRPGHADFPFDYKYGFRDYRGGGRSSGRETIGRVAAGAIAAKILSEMGISFFTYTKSIGPIQVNEEKLDPSILNENPLYMPDADAAQKAQEYLNHCMEQCDSSGGIIECIVEGLPVGLGEPVFDKLDANLAKAMFSIGSVKGFEIGDGFAVSTATGSSNNDAFVIGANQEIQKVTNHSGGTLGGMSDGAPLVFRTAIKPTPSIASAQQTVNKDKEERTIQIKGRHDPVIVPRAVVVVEAMAALTILDALFMNMTSRLDGIQEFYKK